MRTVYAGVSASVDGAKVMDLVVRELEQVEASSSAQALGLADAARESGYSVEQLSRMVRNGTITNAGRKGKPLIRIGDLPRRLGLGFRSLDRSNMIQLPTLGLLWAVKEG
ncbi:MAG: hypothetical protein ACR2KM_13320 [Gemmatimonadaceae bacterium]